MTLLLSLIAVKGIALAIDPTVRLYLGDSAAYLAGGLSDAHLPRDRSFTYAWLLRALVQPTGSLSVLLVWQALAGIGTAVMLWLILVRQFGIRRRLAHIAACVLAIEPAQLFYERMVMAETFGLLAFAAFLAASGEYLRTGRPWWLLVSAVPGLLAASLRLNYLPVVLVASLTVPVIRAIASGRRPPVRSLMVHGVVAACSLVVLHTGYRHMVAFIFAVPPSYMASGGFMQMSLVVPLIRPEHFARAGLPADFGTHLEYPLDDPDARSAHAWEPGGLASAIMARRVDLEPIARALSRMAVLDDPLGLVRLGLHTSANYFRPAMARWALEDDLGRRPYPGTLVDSLRDDWGYDAGGVPFRPTAISGYFAHSAWWLTACLCLTVPVAVLTLLMSWKTATRPHAVLGTVAATALVAATVLFVIVALYRYLHPLPFLFILNAVPLVQAVGLRLRARHRVCFPTNTDDSTSQEQP